MKEKRQKVYCRECEKPVVVDGRGTANGGKEGSIVLGEYICPEGHTTSWLVEWGTVDERGNDGRV